MLSFQRMRRGRFIVLEGPDKSGKSTHAALLVKELKARGLRVVHTREPGGTAFAEAVRAILLSNEFKVHALSELLLYEAARAQHTQDVLLPGLAAGAVVICERYTLASLAYQGFGRGMPIRLVRSLNRIASSALQPDLTLVMDIPETCLKTRDASRKLDRLEKMSRTFHRRVREGYRRLARAEPKTSLINANRPKEEVHKDILRLIERAL